MSLDSDANARNENGAPCYTDTRSAQLDFYNGLVRGVAQNEIENLFLQSWMCNLNGPKYTLQIMMHARSVSSRPKIDSLQDLVHDVLEPEVLEQESKIELKGEIDSKGEAKDVATPSNDVKEKGNTKTKTEMTPKGKGEKKAVIDCLVLLRKNFPNTYKANLARFVQIGCHKDLLTIVSEVEGWAEQGKIVETIPRTKQFTSKNKKKLKEEQNQIPENNEEKEKQKEKTTDGEGKEEKEEKQLDESIESNRTQKTGRKDSAKKLNRSERQRKKRKRGSINISWSFDSPLENGSSSNLLKSENEQYKLLYGRHGEPIELVMFADLLLQDNQKLKNWKLNKENQKEKKKKHEKEEKKEEEKKEEENKEEKKEEENKEEENKEEEKKKTNVHSLALLSKKSAGITLAAKWAPTEGCAHDRAGNLALRIALLMFPQEHKTLLGDDLPDRDDTNLVKPLKKCKISDDGETRKIKSVKRALMFYRKVVSALREHIKPVERQMCTNQWKTIHFSTVPSKAHKLLAPTFIRHEKERYQTYLEDVRLKKKEIKCGTLEIHQLVKPYITKNAELNPTHEVMWTTIVEETRKKGFLTNALALSDVSASMRGEPMEVSIALGILVSLCVPSTSPFSRKVMTFESNPRLHEIKGETLKDMTHCLKSAPWGKSTDLLKCFDLILDQAVLNKMESKDMPTTLFIFSDMQFDSNVSKDNDWNVTTYNEIKEKYKTADYKMPFVVFWNLRSVSNAPVLHDTPGVAMVSGFNHSMLNLFLDGKTDAMTPFDVMVKSIQDYDCEIDAAEARI
jgi:hypothetical protein